MRSKDDKEALLKTGGLRVKGGFCAIIDSIQHDVTVKIHLVDFAVSNETIRQALGEFGEVLEVSNDNWTVAGFEHAISTTRVVRLKLKEGVVLEDLPPFLRLEGAPSSCGPGSGTTLPKVSHASTYTTRLPNSPLWWMPSVWT
ncbi:hypothetical protein HPB51_028177 [Rhipicephalus microplus]|uniref:Uncharacterized protein n=1 Tax=Rhipicephalus microplus TaxID=6941 RepID=A0A9J6CY65_RHIMP|nr:hypothetical protein HPB51_028177 [Rhipicephalus microplus]